MKTTNLALSSEDRIKAVKDALDLMAQIQPELKPITENQELIQALAAGKNLPNRKIQRYVDHLIQALRIQQNPDEIVGTIGVTKCFFCNKKFKYTIYKCASRPLMCDKCHESGPNGNSIFIKNEI